nr:Rieske 2Fe-2S domain-containing protein [Hyphomicrobium sp. CS1BSMeth3]
MCRRRVTVLIGISATSRLNRSLQLPASARISAADCSSTEEGWFCPCHAARFDLAGRVRGGPARTRVNIRQA